jgi:hypothetical protein
MPVGRNDFGFSARRRSNLAISVLLADDSEEFRKALRRRFEGQFEMMQYDYRIRSGL